MFLGAIHHKIPSLEGKQYLKKMGHAVKHAKQRIRDKGKPNKGPSENQKRLDDLAKRTD